MPGDSRLSVASLFEAQVARTPDAMALMFGERALTYAQLDAWAGHVALALRAAGTGPGAAVGLLSRPGPELVAGLLGVLKTGAAYVPLDPAHPRGRLGFLATGARLSALLFQPGERDRVPDCDVPVLPLGEPVDGAAPPVPVPGPSPRDLAYVIYTSGSTGRPKGVEVTHASVAGLLLEAGRIYRVAPGDVGVLTHSFAFDASVLEIFTPLVHGARLVVATEQERRDPARLAALVARHGVTLWDVVPAMLAQVLELPDAAKLCASVRLFTAGADILPPELVRRFFALCPAAELHNQYGPTEATVVATYWRCRPGDEDRVVPIGHPVPGTRIHLLDAAGVPVAAGRTGEIHIGGAGVARGYRGRPGLTAERFVPDPFSADPSARLYRTGDLGRLRADGALEFHGRADRQLSVRGYRVEPGEIEAALLTHPDVRAAAVGVRGTAGGAERLVAWVSPGDGRQCSVGGLREHLGAALPGYMVPTHYVVMDRLPVNSSGKTDHRALPDPANVRPDLGGPPLEPSSPLEKDLAALWSEVLNIDEIGAGDNFFELGGHSILATRAVARIRDALGSEVPLSVIFDRPTVTGLAEWIAGREDTDDGERGPVAGRRSGSIPLSAAQEQVWILSKLVPDSIAYHTQAYLDVRGPVVHELLEAALTEIVRRHEHLRTAFVEVGGEPRQEILEPFAVTVPLVDLGGEPEMIREFRALDLMEGYVARRIDITAPPLFRWVLFRLAPDHHLLLLIEHHFISRRLVVRRTAQRVARHLRRAVRTGETGAARAAGPVRRLRALAARMAGR